MAAVYLTLAALAFHITRAQACECLMVEDGPVRNATVGSSVNFTCLLCTDNDDPFVRVSFRNKIVRSCNEGNLTQSNVNGTTHHACTLTIDPVESTLKGNYTCEGPCLQKTTVLLNVFDRSSMIIPQSDDTPTINHRSDDSLLRQRDIPVHITDPSTGAVLDDPDYGLVVVQSGSTRLFKCLVQDARPGVLGISWTLGDETVMERAAAESPSGGGLVKVSSFFTVKHPRDETGEINLTCTAMSDDSDTPLNTTRVEITFCRGSEYEKTVIGVLISLCVAATIAAIIAEVLIYRHYNG